MYKINQKNIINCSLFTGNLLNKVRAIEEVALRSVPISGVVLGLHDEVSLFLTHLQDRHDGLLKSLLEN